MKNLIFILLILSLVCFPASTKDKVPHATSSLLALTNKFSSIPKENVDLASRTQQEIQHLFLSNINLYPSELYFTGISTRKNVSSQNYSLRLKEHLFDKGDLIIRYTILGVKPIRQPDLMKTEIKGHQTTLKKELVYNNKKYVLWQQIFEPIGSNLVSELLTRDQEIKVKDIITDEKEKLSEEDYLLLGAKYYEAKVYNKAFNTYKTLTEKYPKCGEGWFRLACMVFDNKGCNYKNNYEESLRLMEEARKYGTGKIKEKADYFIYNVSHLNIM